MMKTGFAYGSLILRRPICNATFSSICRTKMTKPDVVAGSELDLLLKKWQKIQVDVKDQIILYDTQQWQTTRSIVAAENDDTEPVSDGMLQYVAGMDISSLKEKNTACVALVVCQLPHLRVVYKDLEIVDLKGPYIPGYLSFREAEFLIKQYEKLKCSNVWCTPQVLLIDGNGVLHQRECGLACHVGVTLDMPTIGIAKNLFHFNGIAKEKEKINLMACKGDTYPLIDDSGRYLGVALRTSAAAENPVYVSVGHKISLETATWLTTKCSLYRIPEPIRQADILSREFLRTKFPEAQEQHGHS